MLEPNSYYKGLVDSDIKASAKDAKKAQERMIKSTAYSHGILVHTLYLPKIFTKKMYAVFKYAADMMYSILDKVIREYESNPKYRQLFGFDKYLEELILRSRTYSCSLPIARIDIFFNEDDFSFKFCEFNADGASAMNEDRELFNVISKTKAFKQFSESFEINQNELFQSWVDEFLKIYSETENAKKNPHIAIVDFLNNEVNNEFEEFKRIFNKNKCTCEICEITKLKYENGVLYSENKNKIDAVYRRAVTCDIMENYDSVMPFINAVKDNSVILIGDFRTQIIHNKLVFKILHDNMTKKILTYDENNFVSEHIPFTTNLTEQALKKFDVLSNKNKWVIKPEDSYASKGVHAGVEFNDKDEWCKTVKENTDNHYLLQEYCTPYELPNIDLLYDSNAKYINYSNITGLFVYNGKLSGVYSRIAKNSIISTQYSEMSLPTIIVSENK